MNKQSAIGVVLVILVVLGWFFRHQITPLDGSGRAYLMNRWTGTIYYLDIDERYEVKDHLLFGGGDKPAK